MVQELRVLAVLPKELDLTPNTYTTHSVTSVLGDVKPSSNDTRHACGAQTKHANQRHTHKIKTAFFFTAFQ